MPRQENSIIAFAVVWAALCLSAAARADNPAAASATKPSQAEQLLVAPERCEGQVFVKIDGKALRIERATDPVVDSHGRRVPVLYKTTEWGKKSADCDRKTIDDVRSVGWQFFEISSLIPGNANEGTFVDDRAREARSMETRRKSGGAELLANGIEKVRAGSGTYFTLPPAVASTGDGLPVVVNCTSQNTVSKHALTPICFTGYTHPSGLVLKYSFFRRGDDPNEFIETDKVMRARLEEMLVPSGGVPPDASPKPKIKSHVIAPATPGNGSEVLTNGNLQSDACDGDVVLQMGKRAIAIPRRSDPLVALEDRSELRVSRGSPCDLKEIDRVREVSWVDLRLGAITTAEQSEYVNWRETEEAKAFEKAKQENGSEMLPNGIEKTFTRGMEFYLLPLKDAPTANNIPVVLSCSRLAPNEEANPQTGTSSCSGSFLHTPDLAVSYRFFRKQHSEAEYLAVDAERRARVETMILEAREKMR